MRDFILEELDKLKTRIAVDLLQEALRDYLIDPCRSEDQDIVQDFCFPLIELLTQEEIYSILYQCFLSLTHARQLDIIYKLKKQESVVRDLLDNSLRSLSYVCERCGSTDICKNGTREGKQQYLCKKCKYQFVK